MCKIIFLLSILYTTSFGSSILKISAVLKQEMIKGNSWKKNCPVPLHQLRLLKIKYLNFEGKTSMGELIVHKDIAENTISVFNELYKIAYPIEKMFLIHNFNAKDWNSIEANNTSGLNCRKVEGTNKWSNHAYGKAIDINPIQNPYVSRKGKISHKNSLKYRKRVHAEFTNFSDKAMLIKNDKAVKIFKQYGWKWGGDWNSIKDYQHLEYKR